MIEEIKKQVSELLQFENSGHGMDHINRVYELSVRFAEQEGADVYVVSLTALLHDADDYKLFGKENSEKLTNARLFMKNANISDDVQKKVIECISNMGFSNAVKGIRPTMLEGKIVSDADMCDAAGVNGILRTFQFSLKHNRPFFNKELFPDETGKYGKVSADSSVSHAFEKLLKLKKFMMTESGKKEIENRHQIMVDILYQLFDEENAPEWKEYLDNYLKNNY